MQDFKESQFLKEFQKAHESKGKTAKKYITQEEACCILDVSYGTFTRWLVEKKHELKKIKIGSKAFFDMDQIETFKKKKLLDGEYIKPEQACCILGVKYISFLKMVDKKKYNINKYFFGKEVKYKRKEIEDASKLIERKF